MPNSVTSFAAPLVHLKLRWEHGEDDRKVGEREGKAGLRLRDS